MPKPTKWTHPIHARSIQSPDLARLSRGKRLTNRKIKEYILEGKYGPDAQQIALENAKARPKRESLMKQALKLLGL